jgi:hypothetical protein
MKGVVLLINEPPNNKRVIVFKYTPLDIKQTNKITQASLYRSSQQRAPRLEQT